MHNTTSVENYFDNPTTKKLHSALETGFACLDTIADLIANQREPLEPEKCEAIGRLIKEVGMMTFIAYERTVKH